MKKIIIAFLSVGLLVVGCGSDGGGGNPGALNGGGTPGAEKTANGLVNLNGSWKGTGTVTANGQSIPCAAVTFQFQQTPQLIKLVQGTLTCSGQTSQFDPVDLTINGSQVLVQNQVIGAINGQSMRIEDDGDDIVFTRAGNQLTLELSTTEGGAAVKLQATLTQ